ncbi:MAG: BamA/TamA family outer membrane protein [Gemmatimonadota bacterium]
MVSRIVCRRVRAVAAVSVAVLGGARAASGQDAPLFLVDGETRVASVSFDVRGDAPFPESRLRSRVALAEPGFLAGVRSSLSWIPLVSTPEPVPFDPVTLQKDVVRLRRFYRENGFPRADVDYRVRLDTVENAVDVTLEVDPGPARILDSVRVTGPVLRDSAGLDFGRFRDTLDAAVGRRFGQDELDDLRYRWLAWASSRGRPFPEVATRMEEGRDPLAPVLVMELDPGPLATVDSISVVEGTQLARETVLQQLMFQPGDTFSSERLSQSTGQLLDLDLVQVALVDLVPDQPRDSTAAVQVRLTEGSRRLISGRTGYSDARGLMAQIDWSHRNFMGGARTLGSSVVAETGRWALGEVKQRRYGASLTLEHPHVLDPRVSGFVGVQGEHADGLRDLARSLGLNLTAVYEGGPDRTLSLRYGVSVRRVVESRGAAGSDELGILDFLRRLEGVAGSTKKTTLSLSWSWGERDHLTRTTRGWTVSGALEGAGLDAWSDVQYLRGDVAIAVLHPLWEGGPRLLGRVRAGRVLPFGRSGPGSDPLRSYLRLGATTFTEGGTQGVRGWAEGALGPKLPDLEIVRTVDSVMAVPTGRYASLGGLARWAGSVEMQLPLPLAEGRHHGLLFLDGAQVWTPDSRYLGPEGFPALSSDDVPRFGVGAGLSMESVVGPIRLMVAYKLNPSPLDLRDPGAVGSALLEGLPIRDVPTESRRRWHLHLAIGRAF